MSGASFTLQPRDVHKRHFGPSIKQDESFENVVAATVVAVHVVDVLVVVVVVVVVVDDDDMVDGFVLRARRLKNRRLNRRDGAIGRVES